MPIAYVKEIKLTKKSLPTCSNGFSMSGNLEIQEYYILPLALLAVLTKAVYPVRDSNGFSLSGKG